MLRYLEFIFMHTHREIHASRRGFDAFYLDRRGSFRVGSAFDVAFDECDSSDCEQGDVVESEKA